MPGATTFDRLLVGAVSLLTAIFAFGAMSVLVTPAVADDTAGKRGGGDDGFELVAKDDDDGDDDGDTRTNTGRGGDDTKSNDKSRDSNSNSKTGTTRGTGQSNSKSNSS